MYKTADFGRTWTKITGGLPADDFARAIREDPKRKGLLFLGTEHGIHVSFDDGGTWQPLRLNMPVTPVHGIQVKNDDLVIGTHGRSFYILDNISVLRQVNTTMTEQPLVLFDPADAIRSVSRGVMVDYYVEGSPRQGDDRISRRKGKSDQDVYRYAAAGARGASRTG